MQLTWHYPYPFQLESGAVLPQLTLRYHVFGSRAPGVPVIWVCHALTANSNVPEWWPGLFGPGKVLNAERAYIICVNMPGSPYGSTAPSNGSTTENAPFPLITIRDMVRAFRLLRDFLEIDSIDLLIGGSMGGQQALEWAISEPHGIRNLVVAATNARHSAWGIAFNEAQRLALALGKEGIRAARAIAMLSYRNYAMYQKTELDEDSERLENFGPAQYQIHQADKLARRFDPDCYRVLSKAMDSHHVGRGRGGLNKALAQIQARTLILGISSDLLFPVAEQEFLARSIPFADLHILESEYGHDGFLTEAATMDQIIRDWLNPEIPHSLRPGAVNSLEPVS